MTPYPDTVVDISVLNAKREASKTYGNMVGDAFRSLASYMPMTLAASDYAESDEAPITFCYSLFYVYYDQYTYITAVLAQDAMLGIAAVLLAI